MSRPLILLSNDDGHQADGHPRAGGSASRVRRRGPLRPRNRTEHHQPLADAHPAVAAPSSWRRVVRGGWYPCRLRLRGAERGHQGASTTPRSGGFRDESRSQPGNRRVLLGYGRGRARRGSAWHPRDGRVGRSRRQSAKGRGRLRRDRARVALRSAGVPLLPASSAPTSLPFRRAASRRR